MLDYLCMYQISNTRAYIRCCIIYVYVRCCNMHASIRWCSINMHILDAVIFIHLLDAVKFMHILGGICSFIHVYISKGLRRAADLCDFWKMKKCVTVRRTVSESLFASAHIHTCIYQCTYIHISILYLYMQSRRDPQSKRP